MKLWLMGAVAATIAAPGAPPPKPNLHYEIRLNGADKPLTAYERLVKTCDLATTVWHFYRNTPDKTLRADLEMLRKSACDLPKANPN